MSRAIRLLCDNEDGTQKQWMASVDTATGSLILRYGRVGRNPRSHIIEWKDMKVGPAEKELEHRASIKIREGYYEDPAFAAASSDSGSPDANRSGKAASDTRVREAIAAIQDDAPEWFF